MGPVIRTLECPVCGSAVRMGLPNGATVESISTEAEPVGEEPSRKVRQLACDDDHEFYVTFVT